MKRWLFFGLLFTSAFGFSQGNKVTLYGYVQTVSRGAAPDRVSGPGGQTGEAGRNYFLYAVSANRIYPSEIWVEGTRYGVAIKTIMKTPVEHSDANIAGEAPKVLVPKTNSRVVQLILKPATISKEKSTKASSVAAKNELVLVHVQNGKSQYLTVKKLTPLSGAAMQ